MATNRHKKKAFGLEPDQVVALVGVVAAIVVGFLANVFAARHYARWDWTTNRRYTLSPATLTTLHDLQEPVGVWVLVGRGTPMYQSIRDLLVAYEAETTRLDVHYVDPDRDAVAYMDVRRRFQMDTSQVASDAYVVVTRGEQRWFVGPHDLIEVDEGDETRVKPREERALTLALRSVLSNERARLCFTSGHGELALAETGPDGLGLLKDILERQNDETASIDTTAPDATEPFKGCAVVIVAGPQSPFTKEEAERLRSYVVGGGNLLAAVGPINAKNERGMVGAGLDEALAPFGIALDDDLVIERDAAAQRPGTRGAGFFVEPKAHPITAALVRNEAATDVPRVSTFVTRSLRRTSAPGAASPQDLLVTSAKAFGVTSLVGAAEWTQAPEKSDRDLAGPFVVAMASERPKTSKDAAHGPRAVVIGARSMMTEGNWRETQAFHGAAYFVDEAIAWLAAKPVAVDVPDRQSVSAALRIDEASRTEVSRYVLLYMPLAAALLAVAVGLRRRATEGAARAPVRPGDGK